MKSLNENTLRRQQIITGFTGDTNPATTQITVFILLIA
jgi:hypothetical protein